MLDIVEISDGKDLGLADSAVMKAANVVGTQLGSLEYAPDFGVDLKFFLESPMQFQNESFKAHLVERLTQHQINVSEITDTGETLSQRLAIFVGDGNDVKGLIR